MDVLVFVVIRSEQKDEIWILRVNCCYAWWGWWWWWDTWDSRQWGATRSLEPDYLQLFLSLFTPNFFSQMIGYIALNHVIFSSITLCESKLYQQKHHGCFSPNLKYLCHLIQHLFSTGVCSMFIDLRSNHKMWGNGQSLISVMADN